MRHRLSYIPLFPPPRIELSCPEGNRFTVCLTSIVAMTGFASSLAVLAINGHVALA